MWNPTSSWQQRIRLWTGILALGGLFVLPAVLALQADGPRLQGLERVARSLGSLLDREARSLSVDRTTGPRDLHGLAVYRMGDDGAGEMVGRVFDTESGLHVLLAPSAAESCADGCDLLYAMPVRRLDQALALLLAPEGFEGELTLARQQVYPTLRSTLLTRMESRLDVVLAELVAELPREHENEIGRMVQDIREALAPETEELVGNLVERSWETVSLKGVAVGIARKAGGTARDIWHKGTGKARESLGGETGEPPDPVDFLSDERKVELRDALEEEVHEFWRQRGKAMLGQVGTVLDQHEETTLKGLKDAWLSELQRRVLEASWEDSREEVLDALADYAAEFARRRMVTAAHGPSLPLAYAIRSGTGITQRPLLVIQAHPGSETVRFLPYVDHVDPRPGR